MKNRIVLIIIFLFAFVSLSGAPYLNVSDVDYSTDYPTARMTVSVNGPAEDIRGLTEDNLSVFEDDFKVGWLSVKDAPASEKIYAALALDCSKSISPELFARYRAAMLRSIDRLSGKTLIALGRFDDQALFESVFSDNRDELVAKAGKMEREGKLTLLFNCLYDAIDYLSRSEGARRAVIVWTDGKDEGSSIGEDDVANFARQKEVPIIFVTSAHSKNLVSMKRIAKLSGGEVLFIENGDGVDACAEYLDSVKKQYLVRFKSMLPRDGSSHTLEVRLKSGKLRDRVELAVTVPKTASLISFDSAFPYLVVFGIIIAALLLFFVAAVVHRKMKERGKGSFWRYGSVSEPDDDYVPADRFYPSSTPEEGDDVQDEDNDFSLEDYGTAEEEAFDQDSFSSVEDAVPVEEEEEYDDTEIVCKAWFIVKEGNDKGDKIDVVKREFVIGSGKRCDLKVKDQNVGDEHAKVKFADGEFILFDLMSSWGTFLNGKKVLRPKKLYDWDEIQMGTTVLIFRTVKAPA